MLKNVCFRICCHFVVLFIPSCSFLLHAISLNKGLSTIPLMPSYVIPNFAFHFSSLFPYAILHTTCIYNNDCFIQVRAERHLLAFFCMVSPLQWKVRRSSHKSISPYYSNIRSLSNISYLLQIICYCLLQISGKQNAATDRLIAVRQSANSKILYILD